MEINFAENKIWFLPIGHLYEKISLADLSDYGGERKKSHKFISL